MAKESIGNFPMKLFGIYMTWIPNMHAEGDLFRRNAGQEASGFADTQSYRIDGSVSTFAEEVAFLQAWLFLV